MRPGSPRSRRKPKAAVRCRARTAPRWRSRSTRKWPDRVSTTFSPAGPSNRRMDSLLRDIRQAARNLVRTPGFALVTILTLALGIGANAAIFSVVNAVILRPLGYPEPDRLIYISSQFPQMGFDQFWMCLLYT